MTTVQYITRILFEALIVGILLIPFAYIGGAIAKRLIGKPSLPDICSKWNKYYIMEWNLLFAGVLFHIWAEFSGLNRYYVQYVSATL